MTTNVKNLFTRATEARIKAEKKELHDGIEALNKKLNSIFIVNSFNLITKALVASLDQLNADLDSGQAPSQIAFDVFNKLKLDSSEKRLMIDILSSRTGIPLLAQFNIKFLNNEIHEPDSMEFVVLKIFTALLSFSWITSIYLKEHSDLETELISLATAKTDCCFHEGVNLGLTSNQIQITKRMQEVFFFDQCETPACAQELINLLVLADGANLKYKFTDSGMFIINF